MLRVAVAASGSGTNLQALLDRLVPPAPASVVLVLSNRADAGALERARRHGVPTAVLCDPASAEEWLALLAAHAVGLLVLAGYLKRVPDGVVEAWRGRIINIHPALLPAFGGAGMYGRRVHEAVLRSGVAESGATVHLVDEVFDHGEIVAQRRVPVCPGDTPETLAARVLAVEHELLPDVVLAAAQAGHVIRLTDETSRRPSPVPATPSVP
ncbi:MAG: phosphoribosylglycinamide formyltransferase [Gemmatimonadota bacterium]